MIKMKMKNFKRFAEQIEYLKKNYPAEMEQFLLDMSVSLRRNVAKRTPKDEGDLKKGWKISDIKREGDKLFITVYNDEFYAPFVEFGHKIVVDKKVVGKVDGHYMFTTSIKAINRQMPRRLKKIFSKLVDEL